MTYKQLIPEQRYAIAAMLRRGHSQKEIAETVGVSPATICREVRRNFSSRAYSPRAAQEMADIRKERLRRNRVVPDWVWARVKALVRARWSPEQVSGALRAEGVRVSHQAIYGMIRADKARGGDLYTFCRHRLKHRRRPVGAASARNIPGRVGIGDRPAEADGTRFGDWEMDTIVGKGNRGAILTLTERRTNFVMAELLPRGKDPDGLARAVVRLLAPYRGKVLTITTDNGSEFARHDLVTRRLGVRVFFAEPYSSWQKGAIENANKLLRQYIPKGTDFAALSPEVVKEAQYELNKRPRKKLGFSTPLREFFKHFD